MTGPHPAVAAVRLAVRSLLDGLEPGTRCSSPAAVPTPWRSPRPPRSRRRSSPSTPAPSSSTTASRRLRLRRRARRCAVPEPRPRPRWRWWRSRSTRPASAPEAARSAWYAPRGGRRPHGAALVLLGPHPGRPGRAGPPGAGPRSGARSSPVCRGGAGATRAPPASRARRRPPLVRRAASRRWVDPHNADAAYARARPGTARGPRGGARARRRGSARAAPTSSARTPTTSTPWPPTPGGARSGPMGHGGAAGHPASGPDAAVAAAARRGRVVRRERSPPPTSRRATPS